MEELSAIALGRSSALVISTRNDAGGHVERATSPTPREEDDQRHGDGPSTPAPEGECQEPEQRLRHQQHAAARQAIRDTARERCQAEDRQVAATGHLAEASGRPSRR